MAGFRISDPLTDGENVRSALDRIGRTLADGDLMPSESGPALASVDDGRPVAALGENSRRRRALALVGVAAGITIVVASVVAVTNDSGSNSGGVVEANVASAGVNDHQPSSTTAAVPATTSAQIPGPEETTFEPSLTPVAIDGIELPERLTVVEAHAFAVRGAPDGTTVTLTRAEIEGSVQDCVVPSTWHESGYACMPGPVLPGGTWPEFPERGGLIVRLGLPEGTVGVQIVAEDGTTYRLGAVDGVAAGYLAPHQGPFVVTHFGERGEVLREDVETPYGTS
jgi:hypothetical protein